VSESTRWIVGIAAAVLVVCLVIWARGEEHHHGIQVGSLGAQTSSSGVET